MLSEDAIALSRDIENDSYTLPLIVQSLSVIYDAKIWILESILCIKTSPLSSSLRRFRDRMEVSQEDYSNPLSPV